MGGGPGEFLYIDGTDFRRIALRLSSDIPYPNGYGSWRDYVISSQRQQQLCVDSARCKPWVPSGLLLGEIASTAFDAWVLDWRHDVMTGRRAAATRDARVISGALNWKAVRAWDPHPSTSVRGDGGTHPSEFGWMIPFIQAVGAKDLARVDRLILSDRPREGGPADPQRQVRRPVRGRLPRLRVTPRGRARVAELPRSPRQMSPSRQTADRLLFEELVHETRDDLLAYAMRRAASTEDAADVLSETYLIAWHKLEQVPPGDSARLWLFGVAANVLRRGAQRQRSSQALIERLASEPPDTGQTEPVEREDRTVRALRALRALRASLASLPARDQEILTLNAWEGLTPKQIGAVTGIPTNVVRVRLHRARARLKRRLTDTQPSASDTDPSAVTAQGW